MVTGVGECLLLRVPIAHGKRFPREPTRIALVVGNTRNCLALARPPAIIPSWTKIEPIYKI